MKAQVSYVGFDTSVLAEWSARLAQQRVAYRTGQADAPPEDLRATIMLDSKWDYPCVVKYIDCGGRGMFLIIAGERGRDGFTPFRPEGGRTLFVACALQREADGELEWVVPHIVLRVREQPTLFANWPPLLPPELALVLAMQNAGMLGDIGQYVG